MEMADNDSARVNERLREKRRTWAITQPKGRNEKKNPDK